MALVIASSVSKIPQLDCITMTLKKIPNVDAICRRKLKVYFRVMT